MEKPLDLRWRKSSYSANGGSDCVEAGHIPGAVLVRDTKDRDGGTLAVSADAWSAFVASLK
jgi:3-mercaptopyruvate sulfurtransferase SseA